MLETVRQVDDSNAALAGMVSSMAAKDTAELIEESIARSQEGSGRVTEVTAAIESITTSVSGVRGIVEEVKEASQQQSQGIDQVTQAIAQMEKVTQTTAATAEENSAASHELNGQTETAMAVVHELERMVGTARPHAQGMLPPGRAKEGGRVIAMAPRPAPRRGTTPTVTASYDDTGTFGRF
jgi:methyl-accepting chemotaxis protein